MDLSALIPSGDTIEVTFEHKGEKLCKKDGDPITWTLWAPHSEHFQEITYKRVVENINKSKKSGGESEEELTVDKIKELSEKRIQELVDITKGFDLEEGGEPVKFSKKSAKDILVRAPRIVSILEEALKSDEDFT